MIAEPVVQRSVEPVLPLVFHGFRTIVVRDEPPRLEHPDLYANIGTHDFSGRHEVMWNSRRAGDNSRSTDAPRAQRLAGDCRACRAVAARTRNSERSSSNPTLRDFRHNLAHQVKGRLVFQVP